MVLAIHTTQDPDFDLEAIKALFQEYNDGLDIDLGFQNFEMEFQLLPGKYHPSRLGQLYLATWNRQPAGCLGIYQLKPSVCELKRLYVKPEFQGLKIGKALMTQAILDARQFGYEALYLDSLRRMGSAQALYRKMGFYEIEPYNQNPYPDVYYMAMDLQAVSCI